jgi:hypothetical protein
MGEIRVHRRSRGYVDRARKYKLMLDGVEVGRLKHGETLAVEAAPGRHRMHLAIDWCRSRFLDIDMAENDLVQVFCWPKSNPITLIYFGSIGRTRAIGVQVLDSVDARRPHEQRATPASATTGQAQRPARAWADARGSDPGPRSAVGRDRRGVQHLEHRDRFMLEHAAVRGRLVYKTRDQARWRGRRLMQLWDDLGLHRRWKLRQYVDKVRGRRVWTIECLGTWGCG